MREEMIANILLEKQAVHLRPDEPFTWTSGIKSPIYCDNRRLVSYPEAREVVVQEFVKLIKSNYSDVQVIAGTATAGIPWASFIAQYMDLPLIYVRSKPKGHGLTNLIEGVLEEGQKVVLIEDLISTGKSSIAAAKGVIEAKGELLSTLAIFTYGFIFASEAFKNEGLKFETLSNLPSLLKCAQDSGLLNPDKCKQVEYWSQNMTK